MVLLLAAVALLPALAPGLVAAATLRSRAPGEVTGADLLTMLRQLAAGSLATATVLTLGGPLTRRTGTAGPAGARIDIKADAAMALVLSVLAATVVGPWALAIGLMRYVYVAASFVRPVLRRLLGFSQLRRVIGGVQGVAMLTAVVPAVPV